MIGEFDLAVPVANEIKNRLYRILFLPDTRTQLDLDHLDLFLRGVLLELVGAEGARALVVDRLAAAEVARAHVPDDVAARQVKPRDAALARVVVEAAPCGPAIQGLDRVRRQGPERHR